jgi:chromosome segregation ATPase
MPPKKGKAPEPSVVENQPPPPDPTVLLYLQAASRAFPHIDAFLRREASNFDAEATECASDAESRKNATQHAVVQYAEERKRFEEEIASLTSTKVQLSDAISTAEQDFQTEFAERGSDNAQTLAEMRKREEALAADSREAQDWSDQSATRLRELEALRSSIEQRQSEYDEEITRMRAHHEQEKRKLRDTLVRRLRRVRDNMTSDPGATEENAGHEGLFGEPPDSSGAATARINEELSREVSVKERDAVAQLANIRQLEAEARDLREKLQTEQEANTQLLLRNASYTKTRRALEAKLADLRSQLETVLGRRDAQEKERLSALRGTVAMQATAIEDLNGEIDTHIEHVAAIRKRIRASRAARTATEARSSAAMRFLWATAADATEGPAQASDVPERHLATICEPLVVPRSFKDAGQGGPSLRRLTSRTEIPAHLLSVMSSIRN